MPAVSADLPPIAIPFNKPFLCGAELEYIAEAIRYGHSAGDGPFTRRAQQIIESIVGSPSALLTTSCTHALEMAAILLGIERGDEVIVPSFTFVSTANAFALRGATPVFCDIRPDTLNIDEGKLEALITPRTRAIVVVHYAGVGCAMDAILDIARRHKIAVVEDNAHGFLGSFRGRPLGSFGSLATLSFHETKNIICGEGGALLVNDPALIPRAEIIREKGTNRARFFRGQIDKYSWVDIGSSYVPSDILAAYLVAQLESRADIQKRRQAIWTRYSSELAEWAQLNGVSLPFVPPECAQPFHMFYLLLPSLGSRQALIAHLRQAGILSVFHYVPLHSSEMGRMFGGDRAHCPVTDDVSARLLRLPFYNGLTTEEQTRVIERVKAFRP